MAGGVWKSGGKTLQKSDGLKKKKKLNHPRLNIPLFIHFNYIPHSINPFKARELQKKGGWLGKTLSESPYKPLTGKWVYFFGDSTLRQIWTSYAAPFQGK
jgi:hypothetical protein